MRLEVPAVSFNVCLQHLAQWLIYNTYSYISFCYCCLINFCWYNKYFSNVSLEVTFLVETSGGFPGGSDDNASVCNAGDPGSIPGLGRSPGEGNGSPLQYSCLENPMDRLHRPRGRKESDTTERLQFTFCLRKLQSFLL